MKTILLSVVMPSYNYAHYLPEAIESVLSQSFTDLELIIIDDCSTDNSLEIAESFAKKDPRVRILRQPKNSGCVPTAMRGYEAARGKYLHWLSADDKYLPAFLEKMVDTLERHPKLGICVSDYAYFNDEAPDAILCRPLLKNQKGLQIYPASEMISLFQTTDFWVPGHTSIIRKKDYAKYGPLKPKVGFMCDWLLYHTIALNEGVAYLPESLSAMRLHRKTYSSTEKRRSRRKTYRNVLAHLRKNRTICQQFKESGLLTVIFENMFWSLLFDPRYFTYWPYINKKFPIRTKLKRSLKKRFGV